MLSIVHSLSLIGIDAHPVEVEVDVTRGLPGVSIVGLPDSSIKESKDRIRSCIKNSGFSFPGDKITVNLAPADMKKEGSCFDLAIAAGILAASGQINDKNLGNFYFTGELSLDGKIKPVKGALAMALAIKKKLRNKIVIPVENLKEASIVKGTEVFAIKELRELIWLLTQDSPTAERSQRLRKYGKIKKVADVDFAEIKGQFLAKRAIEIAVSGKHNILMVGPPGSGKTMLAKRLTTIMPEPSEDEILETTKIHSAKGLINPKDGLIAERPFRAPHHTISNIALVGGGTMPQPGEISLAHNGILFMDELPEFHRDVLEVLRQPLEDGQIRVSRSAGSLVFPANFMLVAAMNPCKCGNFKSGTFSCRCTPKQINMYRSKISGPLLDRIDIHIEVPAVKYSQLSNNIPSENSSNIKKRVRNAQRIQRERFKKDGILYNSQMPHKLTRKYCPLEKEGDALLKDAMSKFHFSGRAYDKILKISRTIADLSEKEKIETIHLAEAIQYRSLDREFFI